MNSYITFLLFALVAIVSVGVPVLLTRLLRVANNPKDITGIVAANGWPFDTVLYTLGYTAFGSAYLVYIQDSLFIVQRKDRSVREIPITDILSASPTRLGVAIQTSQGRETLRFSNIVGGEYTNISAGALKAKTAKDVFMHVCSQRHIPVAQG